MSVFKKEKITITKSLVNKNKVLHSGVLYKKVEEFALESMLEYAGVSKLTSTKYDISISSNAFLKDELVFKSYVKQFDENLFSLEITVEKNKDIICVAKFGYAIQKAS